MKKRNVTQLQIKHGQPMTPELTNVPNWVIARMVLPGPWPCHLLKDLLQGEFGYCGTPSGTCISLCGRYKQPFDINSDGLHPANLSPGTEKNSDSVRLLSPVGALPCCSTPPHCKAPTCRVPSPLPQQVVTCTKAPALENWAYIADPKQWAAYVDGGGSPKLDVHKHWDILGHLLGGYDKPDGEPFDLAVDLGSDWGSVTAAFSSRKLAKDYILLDAWPANKQSFDTIAFGSQAFEDAWFTEQVTNWPQGKEYPNFDFLSYGLSDKAGGEIDICAGPGRWTLKGQGFEAAPCPVPIVALDELIPGALTPVMQGKFAQAQSLYLKMDLDGMDQLTMEGGRKLLEEVRGTYPDGTPRHLVNFMQMEFCPTCMVETQQTRGFPEYDLGTHVRLLSSLGFETFLIGPRYIPLSDESWLDNYKSQIPGGTKDLFAMRSSHPRAAEIKLALGACQESKDFDINDAQYILEEGA